MTGGTRSGGSLCQPRNDAITRGSVVGGRLQAMILLQLFMPLAVVGGSEVGRVVSKRESGSEA